jgi:macrodomain Ter protein organizer (MatP/YcbG family)
MIADPIIEELHRVREEIAAEFNYDLDAIGPYLRQQQQVEGRPVVSFSPKLISREKTMSVKLELPEELYRRLEKLAQLRGVTIPEVIAQILEEAETARRQPVSEQVSAEGIPLPRKPS